MDTLTHCWLLGVLLFGLLLPHQPWAQRGYSDASVAMQRASGCLTLVR